VLCTHFCSMKYGPKTMESDFSFVLYNDYGYNGQIQSGVAQLIKQLGDRGRFLAEARVFHIPHRVQNGSGAHRACYTMHSRGCIPGGKVAGVYICPLLSI
jgi:hypothetical protein